MSDYCALGRTRFSQSSRSDFSVALDGIGEFEATEVSGLGYEIEMIEDEIVGPSGSASLRKMPGHLDYDEIEITRPLSTDTTLWDWMKRLAVDGEDVNGVRSNGTIVLVRLSQQTRLLNGSSSVRGRFRIPWLTSTSPMRAL